MLIEQQMLFFNISGCQLSRFQVEDAGRVGGWGGGGLITCSPALLLRKSLQFLV